MSTRYWMSPAQLPVRRGMGTLGEAAASVAFGWRAVTQINVSDWVFGGGWSAAQARFKSELVRRGFNISNISSEVNSYLPRLSYALNVTGLAPAGIDGAERLIADAAEASGFSVDRGTIQAHFGGAAVPDDRDEDDDKGGDMTPLLIAALVLVVILRR